MSTQNVRIICPVCGNKKFIPVPVEKVKSREKKCGKNRIEKAEFFTKKNCKNSSQQQAGDIKNSKRQIA